jgi:hypothetical protein
MGASGALTLPRWAPSEEEVEQAESTWEHKARATRNVYRTLPPAFTERLRTACRARGTTAGGALCAAALLGVSDVMGGLSDDDPNAPQRYKLLQALDLRRLNFTSGGAGTSGARDDWSGGGVVAGTGSLDLLVDLPPAAGRAVRGADGTGGDVEPFWTCAAECTAQTRRWIERGWGRVL